RLDGYRNIVAHGYTSLPQREVFLRIRDGRYEVGTWRETAAMSRVLSVPVPSEDVGQWVELSGAYDGARWVLYRNGKELAAVPDDEGPVSVAADWAIGGCARGLCAGGGTRTFSGEIARVSIARTE
ncbi:MAG: hypothetical protein HY075_07370, partial [Deltaproteobacteria bacterium]|nr:hypothetical protein [Deltaproteobacteria bacterium]